jgi:hypothetical protein
MRCPAWSRLKLRRASVVLALLGGLAQLAVAFMGDAIGGMSVTVALLVLDSVLALVGTIVLLKWPVAGAIVIGAAGIGAVVALFSTTLFEIGVAALLLGGAAAATRGTRLLRS